MTGHAGFIGFHTADALLREGHAVHGLDSVNDYYDVNLKHRRLAQHAGRPGFPKTAPRWKITGPAGALRAIPAGNRDSSRGTGGVRYSVENPRAYLGANMVGSFNILEACRAFR